VPILIIKSSVLILNKKRGGRKMKDQEERDPQRNFLAGMMLLWCTVATGVWLLSILFPSS